MEIKTMYAGEYQNCLSALIVPANPIYTVDAIHNKPAQGTNDSFEQLMLQKSENISAKIDMLNKDIFKRYEISRTNIYDVNVDQCACKNMIYNLEADVPDKKRIDLERKIIDLEQEKRKENCNCFRDVMFLKKDLRTALVEKYEEEQKMKMLMDY